MAEKTTRINRISAEVGATNSFLKINGKPFLNQLLTERKKSWLL